jgi:MFS family permease
VNTTPSTAAVERTEYRRRVSRPVAFWLVTFAFAVTMFATTLPSPLYPAYEARFRFGSLMVTVIYAVFASGVLGALLLIGRASDTIGRKRVLLPGLALAALSSTLFLITGTAHSGGIVLLMAARVLSGLSAGIFTGTATAALADLAAPGPSARAVLIAALANLGGTGLGPLISGIFARWVALPLQAVFTLHLGLVAAAIVAVAMIPETVQASGHRRPRPQRLGVPVEARAAFVPAAAAAFAGFAVSGLFVAVSPAFLALLGHHNPALTGLVISAMFATATAGMLISGALSHRNAMLAGTGLLIGALAILALALATASLPLLVSAAVTTGASQGLGFRAALESVTTASPPEQRGAVSSSFFAISYVGGISLPVIGVGAATQRFGLIHTGEAFAAIIAALATGALIAITHRGDIDAI